MSTFTIVLVFVFGGIIGVGIGGTVAWMWQKSHLTALKSNLHSAQRDLQNLAATQSENEDLKIQTAELRKEQEANIEKLQWLEKAEEALRDTFQSLAGQALRVNTEDFLRNAQTQVEKLLGQVRGDWTTQKAEMQNLVNPLEKNLATLETHIRQLEQKREGAYKGLEEQVKQLMRVHYEVHKAMSRLTQSLKSSRVRGNWGELQLHRVVEMAGMVKHVDFLEQVKTDVGRPDMIVHLPNGGILPLDAKAPMAAYFESFEAKDSKSRNQKLNDHVKAIRERTRELSKKEYWRQFEKTPEFVVMFIPNEASLHTAFELEPQLLEKAMEMRVLIATPVTLLAMLKAVAYGWQQYHMSENTRLIAEEGKELHKRLIRFANHLDNLGNSVGKVVDCYNKSLGSFERRLMPSVRRLEEMEVVSADLSLPQSIEQKPRIRNSSE